MNYLQGSWTVEFSIACGFNRKEIVSSDVHDDELVSSDEADAVGPGREAMSLEIDRHFGDKVRLVFLLNAAGVARGIDESCEQESILRELNTCGVASLSRCALAAEEDGRRKEGSRFGCIQYPREGIWRGGIC